MALAFPRDLYVEMWLGKWVDITGAVRQDPGITMSPGRGNEQGRVTPNRISFHLKNGTDLPAPFAAGDFTPGNPKGQYHGKLGRNTPARGGVKVARDTFTRTVVDGWGSTTTGEAYTLSGTAADFDVNGSAGTMFIASAINTRRAYLASLVKLGDYEVIVDITMATPVNGQDVASIMLRGTSTSDVAAVDVDVTSAGVVRIAIRDAGDSSYLVAPTTVSGVSVASTMRLHALVEGQTIRGKLYNTSADEPYDWQATAHTGNINRQGWTGLRSITGSGNTNVTFTFDNLTVRIPRLTGETADLRPRWDETHKHKWVEVDAAGIMRRLEQGKPPAKSAIERYVVGNATQPLVYWPLDDGNNSLVGRVAAGSGLGAIINNVNGNWTPGFALGTGDIATWMNPVAAISHDAFVRCSMITSYFGSWTFHCAFAYTGGQYTTVDNSDGIVLGTSSEGSWTITIDSFNAQIHIADPNSVTVATITPEVFDDSIHHMGFRSTQNGADVDWAMFIDGSTVASGTRTNLTSKLTRFAFQQNTFQRPDNTRIRAFGHIVFYSGNGPSVAEIYDAIFGHPGETAGRRMERVCSEAGIAFDHIGSLDNTATMGPQGAASTLAILRECEESDLGTLYESRCHPGLTYRTVASLCNQAHTLTLDYSAGQLAAPLHPFGDDRDIRNDVTAKRKDGGEARSVQETGPLNVGEPGTDPEAVGRYESSVTVNVEADDQLADVAGWIRHLGTVATDRYPKITVNLASTAVDGNTDKELSVLAVSIDNRFAIDNLTAADIYGSLDQLARGYTERLSRYHHEITFNTAPSVPYTVFDLDTGRLDSDAATLNEDLDATEAGVDVAISDGTLWTTDPAEMPFDIEVGGEVMRVTAVTGASSPQTFTVTRNINGAGTTHSIGDRVQLASRAVLALR